MFLAFGFLFNSDLNKININLSISDEFKNSELTFKKTNEFNNVYFNNQIENLTNNSFKSIDEIYKFTNKVLNIAISNIRILENYDGFKIACGVIAFTREKLLEKNLNKYQEGIELNLENKISEDKIEIIVYPLNKNDKKDDILLDEEKKKFRWNNILKKTYGIEFEEFRSQYEIIKR